jgi:hypothetical protein
LQSREDLLQPWLNAGSQRPVRRQRVKPLQFLEKGFSKRGGSFDPSLLPAPNGIDESGEQLEERIEQWNGHALIVTPSESLPHETPALAPCTAKRPVRTKK